MRNTALGNSSANTGERSIPDMKILAFGLALLIACAGALAQTGTQIQADRAQEQKDKQKLKQKKLKVARDAQQMDRAHRAGDHKTEAKARQQMNKDQVAARKQKQKVI